MAPCHAMIGHQVTLSGDAEWPKVADAVIEAPLSVLIAACGVLTGCRVRHITSLLSWRPRDPDNVMQNEVEVGYATNQRQPACGSHQGRPRAFRDREYP